MATFQAALRPQFWEMIMLPAFQSTIVLVILATLLGTAIGFVIALLLLITNRRGIHPNRFVYGLVSFLVNMIRSFPFVILMVFLLPFTKMITGTSIGIKAALVPLTVAATAFIAKMLENAMQEIDPSLIEAMKSFGITDLQLVLGVILSETLPGIISGIIMATIAILGSTAMAGTMGAGGIGAVAITYGYQSFNRPVMFLTALILIVMVQMIQMLGDWVYKKMKG